MSSQPPLAEEISIVDGVWGREVSFLKGVASSGLPMLQWMAHTHEYIISTNWTLWGIFLRDINLGRGYRVDLRGKER